MKKLITTTLFVALSSAPLMGNTCKLVTRGHLTSSTLDDSLYLVLKGEEKSQVLMEASGPDFRDYNEALRTIENLKKMNICDSVEIIGDELK